MKRGMTDLAEMVERFRARHNIPQATTPYVAPAPECDTCGDLGLVTLNVGIDDPMFSKPVPCPHCERGRENLRRHLIGKFRQAGLPAGYESFSFESFFNLPASKLSGKALGGYAAYLWAGGKGSDGEWPGRPFTLEQAAHLGGLEMTAARVAGQPASNWLVLFGGWGTGKSTLAACATQHATVVHGVPCLYYRLSSLLDDIYAEYDKGKGDKGDGVLFRVQRAPMLALDEVSFNSTNPTDHQRGILEKLVRYRQEQGLATLMTMNHTPDSFSAQWGVGSAEMVRQAHWVKLGGESLRTYRTITEDEDA